MSPYDYPDYDSGDDFSSFFRIITIIFAVALVITIFIAITSPCRDKTGEGDLSFEERVQEEYLDCVSKAVNRDSELLTSCKDILEVLQ